MKTLLLFVPALILAAPAAAAPTDEADVGEITRILADPRMADQMTAMTQALSRAMLNMPVGEIEAAVQGRPVTPADKLRTVGTATGMTQQQLDAQIAAAQPAIRSGMKAMSNAIPAMMQAMTGMAEQMERAIANMPDPTYPKR
jgi:hypothetical protein